MAGQTREGVIACLNDVLLQSYGPKNAADQLLGHIDGRSSLGSGGQTPVKLSTGVPRVERPQVAYIKTCAFTAEYRMMRFVMVVHRLLAAALLSERFAEWPG